VVIVTGAGIVSAESRDQLWATRCAVYDSESLGDAFGQLSSHDEVLVIAAAAPFRIGHKIPNPTMQKATE